MGHERDLKHSALFVKDSSGNRFKKFHASDIDFYKPRGAMFTYSSGEPSSDYNLGGRDTATYPTSGVNLAWGGASAPGHGIYVVPKTHQVMYVSGLRLFYNHNAKSLFAESYKDRISEVVSNIQIMHNSNANCSCVDPACMVYKTAQAPIEVADALAVNEYFYSQEFPLECPGRFDGDEGDSFGIRASGGNGIYLGSSFAANKLTHMYFQFTGWVVGKVQLADGSWDEVIPI